jgi:starvation-inducible DNA-binding protein
MKNNVGLDTNAVKPVITKLEDALADYQVFYANLRGFHWHVRGDKFFELHALYEEYYNEVAVTIDAIAERVVMLGGLPDSRFSVYLTRSSIKEISGITHWRLGITNVLGTIQHLLSRMRDLHATAFAAGETDTISLATHAISSLEKKTWMLSAYLQD